MPRFAFSEKDGALLDTDKLMEWDPANRAWGRRGRYVGEYDDANSISDEEAARIMAASPSPAPHAPAG